MNIHNDRRLPPTQQITQSTALSIPPAKWTTIRTETRDIEPGAYGTANNMYQRAIPLDTNEPLKRLTIKLTSKEYESLQALYDFTQGKFSSLDEMIRQMLIQPEMVYRFLDFLSIMDNESIDFVTKNKPEGFNWC